MFRGPKCKAHGERSVEVVMNPVCGCVWMCLNGSVNVSVVECI